MEDKKANIQDQIIKKEIKEYKKNRLKKLIIPGKNTTFLDVDDERRNNGIYSLKNEELNIKVNNEIVKSPRIKHFEKVHYLY